MSGLSPVVALKRRQRLLKGSNGLVKPIINHDGL